MEKTKKRVIYLVIKILILILGIANICAFYFGFYTKIQKVSEIVTGKIIIGSYTLSLIYIFQMISWLIVLLMIFLLLFGLLINKQKKRLQESVSPPQIHGRFKTELDTLYSMVEKNKKLKLSEISRAFEITEEKALEWIKILENNNLVIIEYPAFSSPIILIKEKNEKT
jgi:uncharacterized membrane protein